MWPKRIIVVAAAAFLGAGLLVLVYLWRSVWSNPEALIVPEVVDFGTTEAGQVVQADVVVRNQFRKAVTLHNFRRGCGCLGLVVLGPQGEQPPGVEVLGPSTEILLRVRFPAYPGTGAEVHHQFWFQTDLPERPEIAVTVRGRVWVPLLVLPRDLKLGRLRPGETTTATVRLIDCRAADQRLPFQIVCSHPHVTFGSPSLSDEPSDYEDLPEGVLVYKVTLQAKSPDEAAIIQSEYQVVDVNGRALGHGSFSALVEPVVTLVPSSITLPRYGTDAPYAFRAMCRSDVPCEIVPKQFPSEFTIKVERQTIHISCQHAPPPPEGTRELLFHAQVQDGGVHLLRLVVTIVAPLPP